MQASLLTATANFTGYFCFYLALAMILPMTADLAAGSEDWRVFMISGLLVGGASLFVIAMTRGHPVRFSPRFGFVLINALWISASLVAALPLYLSSLGLTLAEAVFEGVSGMTTTGSTVIVGLDDLPPGLLLWRSLTQMLGGIGVVAAGLLLLPFLNVGGMQIFRLEFSGHAESPFARFRQFALALVSLYGTLTVCCTLGYAAAGMSTFDAVNHAMATVSTGGFSTRDASLRDFGSAALLVGIVFMLLGAMPFAALLRAIVQRDVKAALDPQIPVFLAIVAAAALVMTLLAMEAMEGTRFEVALHAVFNTVSILTTTGFVSAEYDLWGPLAVAIVFVATFIGGCAGSTSGGFKIHRLMILFQSVAVLQRQMVRPHDVRPLRYGRRPVEARVLQSVTVFASAFLAVLFAMTLALAAVGLDLVTALTGSLAALTNVGPGLGSLIGPSGTFEPLPEAATWVLSAGMLMGRLDVLAVLVLASPSFWRD